jgi:Carboxypeptidase regulatory-like domain
MRVAALTIVLALGTSSAQSPAPQPAKGSIRVIVREGDSGLPVEGAEVTVERSGGGGPTAVTNVTGTAEIPDLAAGSYRIRVTYKSEIDATVKVAQLTSFDMRQTVVKPGATSTVEITIRRPATLRGQVLTPEGRPVVSAPIAALLVVRTFRGEPVLGTGPPNGVQATTDAEGRFVVVGLRPGRYFVRVSLPAVNGMPLNYVYAPGVTSVSSAMPFTIDSGDDVSIGISAVAAPTVDLEGRVIDQRGGPIGGTQIKLRALDQVIIESPNMAITSDRDGHFVLKAVRIGTYALQATRPASGNESATLVGATELHVEEKAVGPLEVKVVPGALITGQMLFNGVEQLDPGRTEIRVRAEGDDADLRQRLSPAPEWHADGSFAISGVVGRHRLELQSNTNWFIERAYLEDGTDVAESAFDFEPGRIYRRVRVLLSDETAEITGQLPRGWAISPFMIVAFPEDAALWSDPRYMKVVTGSGPQTQLTIKGVPPGRNYLVAIWVLPERRDGPVYVDKPAEFLGGLVPAATRVFVDGPGKFTVNLPDPRR